MWYRVEVNPDGSVHSCSLVEAEAKGRKAVSYVEATSAEEAIALIRRRVESRDAARRVQKRAQYAKALATGLCPSCKCRPRGTTRLRCDVCTAANRRWEARGGRTAERTLVDPVERAVRITNQIAEQRTRRAIRLGKVPGVRGAIVARARLYELALNTYREQGPEQFRAWLEREIEKVASP